MKCRIIFRTKYQEIQLKLIGFLFLFLLIPMHLKAQDSIPIAKDLTEEKELEFQAFFFKALSEKSIGNYQNAVQNLENCNQLLPNDVSVFFEFSKNYLLLNQYIQAKEYITRAIQKQPKNIWLLKHYVSILERQRNYDEAIDIQQKIIAIEPKEKEALANLYILKRDYKEAFLLIQQIEKERPLSSKLKYFKNFYVKKSESNPIVKKTSDANTLKTEFESKKTYKTLLQLLNKLSNSEERLKYVEIGLQLFPAQAFLYLEKGKALFEQKQYKNTISVLENGIDFVLEDKMMKEFYQYLFQSNQKIGNKEKEEKYKLKFDKIKR